jgi:transcriptional regulator with XRE-family HTH domain
MTPAEVVGQNLKASREGKGLSQRALGKLVEPYLGEWVPQQISAAEHGRRGFSAAELMAFASVLAIRPAQLLTPRDPDTVIDFGDATSVPWTALVPPLAGSVITSGELATVMGQVFDALDEVYRGQVAILEAASSAQDALVGTLKSTSALTAKLNEPGRDTDADPEMAEGED